MIRAVGDDGGFVGRKFALHQFRGHSRTASLEQFETTFYLRHTRIVPC